MWRVRHFRSEHWIVAQGAARLAVDDGVIFLTGNQPAYIPLGGRHRMEDPGKVPTMRIKVQTGRCLGEDDIIAMRRPARE